MGCLILGWTSRAQEVIFHLRNGDRITGTITAENEREVQIVSTVAGKIALPLDQIQRRERKASSAGVGEAKPAQPTPQIAPTASSVANAGNTNKATTAQVPANPPPPPSKFKQFLSDWQGDAQIGVNLGFSTKDHQTYTARLKAVYTPIKVLRNSLDYLASYGTTDGVLSENQMDGSWKLEYDLGQQKRFLVYNAIGAGYNEIQKIDLRYDIGPGMGYKVIVRTNYVLKAEFGGNFQQQYFSTGEDKSRISLRLAEDITWQITSRLKFDHKLEFFPEIERPEDYRIRAEANLSYLLRNNLTLSLSVIDLYDTTPATGVSNNDLQIRSLIGLKF
ncbi:MAG: DUF481 domain-containing protein [Verrucomicrobiales bacterium]|nr:DUF481 domain-containing protein [Verrucomicrobiales bacterium]